MQAILSFDKDESGKYHMNQSDLKIDFGLNKKKGGGVYGERVVMVNNFKVNTPAPIRSTGARQWYWLRRRLTRTMLTGSRTGWIH